MQPNTSQTHDELGDGSPNRQSMEAIGGDELTRLAEKISADEHCAWSIAKDWYSLSPARTTEFTEIDELLTLVTETHHNLERLAAELSQKLQHTASPDRPSLQYAYHLAKELMQSRAAVMELLQSARQGTRGFQEDFRAIAIKERAAAEQTAKLVSALLPAH